MAADREIAFPTLSRRDLNDLRPRGTVRHVPAGTMLWSEGDRDPCFFVILSGRIEILDQRDGVEHQIAVHEPGAFTGDVDMLTGRRALVSARVLEDAELLALAPAELRRVLTELPEVGETVLKAFLTRRTLLLDGGFEGIKIIGSRFSPPTHALRQFMGRNAIPFTFLDLESDAEAEELMRAVGLTPSDIPVVIFRDGTSASNPTIAEVAHAVGLGVDVTGDEVYDLIVVGAGPAGLAASVYAASEGLRTLTLDSIATGGQAGTSSRIENYLGFPTGITGNELALRATVQAEKFGVAFSVPTTVVSLRLQGGDRIVHLEDGSEVRARAVLIASGIEYRRLDVPRLEALEGAGVYYAATEMEARLCGGDEVVVVGGGNSAGQAVVLLARTARRVHLVIRGDDLGKSMSRYLVDRIEGMPNVSVHAHTVVAALDGEEALTGVHLRTGDGTTERIDARALFIFIGATPHTRWLEDCVELDAKGFVITGTDLTPAMLASPAWRIANRRPLYLETSLPGVFAAGDARAGSVKRVASAVGEGAMAISFVHSHIGTAR
jgi:thioredoxin reductase (NADPH)